MGVAYVGLVHRDPCKCKFKGFRAVSSIERNVSNRRHLQGVRQLRVETGEERRISGDEDDPVIENPIAEIATELEAGNEEEEEDEAAVEDEEEEEDPGLGNSGDDNDDDDDSPPASSHKPVTQSTPKKQPVSRPKQKAYRNKSGPGSSSRKQTRNRR